MSKRPATLDDVDWEAAADALIKAGRNMTDAEVADHAELIAAQLTQAGSAGQAEALRRAAAVIRRRLLH
jgi:hypothetical protein